MKVTRRSSSRAWWTCPARGHTRWSWMTRACSNLGQATRRRALWRTKTRRDARKLDSCLKTRIASSTMAKSCVECFKFAVTETPSSGACGKTCCYWGLPLAQLSLSMLPSPQDFHHIFYVFDYFTKRPVAYFMFFRFDFNISIMYWTQNMLCLHSFKYIF
jgi:hypothetical protein